MGVDAKAIANRLARVEGQIRGVRGMIEGGRPCEEIVDQLSACHAALESATKAALLHYFEECLVEVEDPGAALERVADLVMKTRF